MMATPLVSVYYTKFSFNSVINHYHTAYHFHPTTMLVRATMETDLSSLFINELCSAASNYTRYLELQLKYNLVLYSIGGLCGAVYL